MQLSSERRTRAKTVTADVFDEFILISLMALAAAFFFIVGIPHSPLKQPHIYVYEPTLTAPGEDQTVGSLITTMSRTELARLAAEEANLSPAQLINRWQPFIHEASQRFSVPANWIRAVIRIESGGRTTLFGRPITSGAGAMGVMQLMRDTYNDMREEHDLGPNPYNVRDNILAGTAYLRVLYQRYGYPFLFAAYNAGPGRLEAHLHRGHALPAETRAYVKGAVQVVAETCAQKKKGIVLATLSKLSPVQPAMAAEGCIKVKA
jgi:hypothetical protein